VYKNKQENIISNKYWWHKKMHTNKTGFIAILKNSLAQRKVKNHLCAKIIDFARKYEHNMLPVMSKHSTGKKNQNI
jgi:proteasome assembly chaperone (PAC2) family protein